MPAQDYFTIRVDRATGERHNERRKEMDVTWAEYLDGEAPDPVDVDDLAEAVADNLRATLPEDVAEEVHRRLR